MLVFNLQLRSGNCGMTLKLKWNSTIYSWFFLKLEYSFMQHFLSLAHFISWRTISWLFSHLSQHSSKQLFKQFLSLTLQAGKISNDIHLLMNQYTFKDRIGPHNNVYLWIFFRYAYTPEQVRNKPGREVVTFLLVCNLAMWAINTLETNRADSHPIQVRKQKLDSFRYSVLFKSFIWLCNMILYS